MCFPVRQTGTDFKSVDSLPKGVIRVRPLTHVLIINMMFMNDEVYDECEVIEEKDYQPDDGLIKLDDIYPILKQEGISKGLEIFLFTNEEVNKYHKTKNDKVGILLLAKDKDTALWNLKSLRRCYAVKI